MGLQKPVAVVGLGAVLPDAMNVAAFWNNIKNGRSSISEVPAGRWRLDLYYHPDPSTPEKTYSKIGGWVKQFQFDPFKWGIAIPPSVLAQMDEAQQWSIAACRQALVDYGYPQRNLDATRVAVILGNALGGEKHYNTSLRIRTPEFLDALANVPAFEGLPADVQAALLSGLKARMFASLPEINEDTMAGELSNIIAGRVANVFNFSGPNFVTDAACASSMAALQAAVEGLNNFQFDAVLTGGVDRLMSADAFVKFCKIGALSPDGSRPYAEGANGFVMGEGAGILLLKRLEDAERDGDKVYAVVRGIGGSSDGKGKGITAPNPYGQQQAIRRAWINAGVPMESVGLIEGHGTSTRVGDVAEVTSLNIIFGALGLPSGKIALGSVKSNIGHLKSAAGAAGLLKAVLALHEKVLPPSINFQKPNPAIDFTNSPFQVNTSLNGWEVQPNEVRRAGVSAFGFGGTNFHVVLEEYIPGILAPERVIYSGVEKAGAAAEVPIPSVNGTTQSLQLKRGLLFLSADTTMNLKGVLDAALMQVRNGSVPASKMPTTQELSQLERLAIDYGDVEELIKRCEKALKGFGPDARASSWQVLTGQGIFRGSGRPGKVAFLFPGQGSQYVNMLRELCSLEPVVADTYQEADAVMSPILGRSLTSYIYVDGDEAAQAQAEKGLRNTAITQPAVLTANVAIFRLMKQYGYQPDMVIGHSLGEYAALVAAGVLSFSEALKVVSARGREMANVSMDDNGCMAAVSAPLTEVDRILKAVDGYVVIANINSPLQSVIGGTTPAVDSAIAAFQSAGFQAVKIPVSHAFHTQIVAPVSGPLREVIARMQVKSPQMPIVANVTGELYPNGQNEILDILAQQVASPVQFVQGIQTLYAQGARVFVEVGPKRVLSALATDILKEFNDVSILATNHPRKGALISFNEALCGLAAAGVGGKNSIDTPAESETQTKIEETPEALALPSDEILGFVQKLVSEKTGYPVEMLDIDLDLEADLGIDTVKQAELFAAVRAHYNIPRREDLRLSDYSTLAKVVEFVVEGCKRQIVKDENPSQRIETNDLGGPPLLPVQPSSNVIMAASLGMKDLENEKNGRSPLIGSVVVSGAGLGLPGKAGRVFSDDNIERILSGEMFIEEFPLETRQNMLDRRVTRLNKSELGATMDLIDQMDQTIKLGGQRGQFDLADEFGVPAERVDVFDISTRLATAAGIEALRDAGIPLVMAYRQTSKGTFLPDRWRLPEALADETGVIFASAFPGLDQMAQEADKFYEFQALEKQAAGLRELLNLVTEDQVTLRAELHERIQGFEREMNEKNYQFDRKFIFRILAMGHSQFAEYIGARGPNTHVNVACASTTHAVAMAEDWIRAGRCRRVVVVAGDDVTGGNLVNWVGTGLMASGAATIEGTLRLAALPFDRRRNGMIMGMGAAALVIEAEDAVQERGMRGVCEVLSTQIANSAFHGTRLDVQHVSEVMERLVWQAENRFRLNRKEMAGKMVFISHETYTPARGGSAAAEIHALRQTFGEVADRIVIANTKGFTGHTMGVGVEDVVAVKSLQQGVIPPIAFIKDGFEADPDLGDLNLSKGGQYNPQYALRLGAGFGSQIAMSLLRRIPGVEERVNPEKYKCWLAAVAGYETAELEVVKRTLRITNQGAPVRLPVKSIWQYGQGPTAWADHEESELATVDSKKNNEFPVEGVSMPSLTAAMPRPAQISEGVKEFVLKAVSEKTGYPQEMLDLDLDLEADLGIDTVKQAELFAAVRTHYNIPRREDLRLSDYNTLAKVIQFVKDGQTVQAPQVVAAVEAQVAEIPIPAFSSKGRVGEIQQFVLKAVSEKTGYPQEMLDLDLDLEADLGIDTVKQAELFAAVRTHYDIPRREDLRLSDYNTLAKVIQFVKDGQAAAAGAATVAIEVQLVDAKTEAMITPDMVIEPQTPLEPSQKIARRVVVPLLRPRLDLCTPTSVKLGDQSRVLVMGGGKKISDELMRQLRSRKVKVFYQSEGKLNEKAKAWLAEGNLDGVYFLAGLAAEERVADMNLSAWHLGLERHIFDLFCLMRELTGNPFLVCATRMGGLNGYDTDGCKAAMGGTTSGFAKALAWECPDRLIKTIDFELAASANEVSDRLIRETLHDPATVEVGWHNNLRYDFGLEEKTTEEEPFDLPLGSVFVISGGSGGITAPVVLDLARATKGKFYLLNRTVLPESGDENVRRVRKDLPGLKLDLARQMTEKGLKATPAAIEKELAGLERMAALLDTVSGVEKAGGTVLVLTCDVTDPHSVEQAVAVIAQKETGIDCFIHAAGVERSRKLESKPEEEFRQTILVKADGFFNLFKAFEKVERLPRAVVFFSSVSGRFGNAGQTDYSAANDLLCKLATALPQQYRGMKALALDWGAWAEVGMASRGYIPELMKRAGIEMMQPESAASLVWRELIHGKVGGEVVLAGSLGRLGKPRSPEGGMDLNKANQALRAGKPMHVMLSSVIGMDVLDGIVLEAELDPENEPFLKDHAINGIPLLPGVMGIEGFSVAARHIASVMASEKGGFIVTRLEDIQFLAPFKFYRGLPRRVTWKAQPIYEKGGLTVCIRLESTLALKSRSPERMVHFSGKVHLQPMEIGLEKMNGLAPHWNGAFTLGSEDIYRLYFHGPSFQVLDGVQRSGNQVLGKLRTHLPSIFSVEEGASMTPLLVELCLQTAGIWEAGKTGVLALPSSIGALTLYQAQVGGVPIYAEVTPQSDQDGRMTFDARVVDEKGLVYLQLKNYRTQPLPYAPEQKLINPLLALLKDPEGE